MNDRQIQIFISEDGQAHLEVTLEQETIWLSQAQMENLFATTSENVLMHLRNIFKDDELSEQAVNLLSRTLTNQGLVSTEGEAT